MARAKSALAVLHTRLRLNGLLTDALQWPNILLSQIVVIRSQSRIPFNYKLRFTSIYIVIINYYDVVT